MSEVFHKSFQAWNCSMSIELIKPTKKPEQILQAIKNTLTHYEKLFSRFQPNSLTTQLNKGEEIVLIPELAQTLKAAKEYSRFTEGLFNPHVNLPDHGYNDSFEKNHFTKAKEIPPPLVFPEGLIETSNTIKLKENAFIDFGGFLKGYLAEIIADQHQQEAQGIIVNLGGDIATRGKDLDQDSFEFFIKNPVSGKPENLHIQNMSLATSGTYKRKWETNTGQKSHLIDPQKNQSTDSEFIAISFWGKSGGLVDGLATAAFFTNKDTWDLWCEKAENLHYLAIKKDGTILTK